MKSLAESLPGPAVGSVEPRETVAPSPHACRRDLESAVALAATAILVVDADGAVRAASRSALALMCCAPEQLHGEPAAMFLPLLTGTPVAEVGYGRKTVAVRPDGTLLQQVVSAIVIEISDFRGWLLLLRDDESFVTATRARWH